MVIVGQCIDLVISKLESEGSWKNTEAKNNIVELLKMIKDIAYMYETQSYLFKAVHNTMRSVYLLYQRDGQTPEQYLESFLNNVDIIKHCDGSIGKRAKLAKYIQKIDKDKTFINSVVIKLSLKKSIEAYFAYAFILGANRKK
eukprot:9550810-Ditylum_brightwellii.AAC.1